MDRPTHIKTWTRPKLDAIEKLLDECEGDTFVFEDVEFTKERAAWIIKNIGRVLRAGQA